MERVIVGDYGESGDSRCGSGESSRVIESKNRGDDGESDDSRSDCEESRVYISLSNSLVRAQFDALPRTKNGLAPRHLVLLSSLVFFVALCFRFFAFSFRWPHCQTSMLFHSHSLQSMAVTQYNITKPHVV